MTSWQAPSATVSFTYDPNGNMTSKSGFSENRVYGWDFENRLISARRANKIVRYDYDALGRKVSRFGKAVGPTAKYTYDGQDIILDDGSEGIVKYQNGPGIDNKLKMVIGGQSKYFLQDHLGSTVALAGQDGAVLEQTDYEAFGEPTNDFSTRYQFTGRELDPFTGLYYYRARWYNPQLGRFISEDPIGFGGRDVNLYAYVWNNPQNFVDPSGTIVIVPVLWAIGEFCGTAYDVYDFGSSLTDPNSDWGDVAIGGGGLLLGVVGPGAGYGKLGKGVRKYFGKGGVYRLADDGATMRTGRSVDLPRREREHALDPRFKTFKFEPLYRTDDYDELRGLEQLVHDNNPGAPFNFRNPISPRNPNIEKYKRAADCAPCRKK